MNYITNQRNVFQNLERPFWRRVTLPTNLFPQETLPFKDVAITPSASLYYVELAKYLEEHNLNNLAVFTRLELKQIERTLQLDEAHNEHLGRQFTSYINGFANHGLLICAAADKTESVELHYHLSVADPVLIDHHLVVAKAGATLNVIIDYHSEERGFYEHYGAIKVVAERGAQVKVTQIQRLNDESHSFSLAFSDVAEGGKVTFNDAQIGSALKAYSNVQTVAGRRAEAATYALYYGQANSDTDVSYTMKHQGKTSHSTILTKGAMQEGSKKVVRGNLIFEKDSTGAVGREEEFVVLLSDKLKSDSIPGLFCEEDDVIGEHAASIGQVDENKLFYLMSRGFSEAAARKLIIKSAYQEVIEKMDIGAYGELLEKELEMRIN